MNKKPIKNPVTLTLEGDLVVWLRDFLYEESLSAEIDHENVETLHTDIAISAAKIELSRVHARLTNVIEALDAAIAAARDLSDVRKAIAKATAAATADMPPVA